MGNVNESKSLDRDEIHRAEIEHAEIEVKEATERLEHAINRFSGTVQQGRDQIESIRQRADELVDRAKHPKAVVDYALNKREEITQKIHENVEYTMNDVGRLVDQFVSRVRVSAEQGLKLMDEKPLVSWFGVLLSGVVLGAILTQMRVRQRIETTVVTESAPVPSGDVFSTVTGEGNVDIDTKKAA